MAKLKQTSTVSSNAPVLALSSAAARGTHAPEVRPYLVPAQQRYLALFPHESEDARLTGETRSLYRRLLALNLPKRTTVTAAAIPATPVAKRVAPVFVNHKIA
jgi:hypothetical protein